MSVYIQGKWADANLGELNLRYGWGLGAKLIGVGDWPTSG